MRRAVLSPLAQQDLRSIWLYSAEEWGRKRASLYISDIRQAIDKVAKFPKSGRGGELIREGYFKWPVGSHIIFYRMLDNGVEIVRILHQSMDFERHL